MISKFLKFFSNIVLIAIFGFYNEAQSAASNDMMAHMIIGIGGDLAFAISKTCDFKLHDTWTGDPNSPKLSTFPFFYSRYDSSTGGGNAKFGYLMANGFEGAAEFGYRQIKFEDRHHGGQSMESHVLSGMLNATYYLDLGNIIYPYASAGLGIGRSNIKATMVGETADKNVATVRFNDMKEYRLTYQAGAGISTVMQSVIVGVGYKFFGVAQMKDSKNYADITASIEPANLTTIANNNTGSAATDTSGELDFTSSDKFKFNKIRQSIHAVEAFVKMVI